MAAADGDSDMGWSLDDTKYCLPHYNTLYLHLPQTVFAGFMTKALSDAGIPFAVNADTKYYNAAENTWISSMQPVFKTIFQ